MTKRGWLGLFGFLAVCYGVAALGGISTAKEIPGWYAHLHKPGFTPPNWVFGPVWSLLYTLMAVAAWLVWKARGAKLALGAFWVQLGLNLAWSEAFFALHGLFASTVVIAMLWVVIVVTIVLFWRSSRTAGAMMVPYLAWVSYATALNVAIMRMN
jgi:benzodiazapine receptor